MSAAGPSAVHVDPVHVDAVSTLTAYAPHDPQQAVWRREFLAQLAGHADATRRDGPPAHLTASAIVLDAGASSTLLVHHRKAGVWVQPGGHLEPSDPSVQGAALREVTEETGLGRDRVDAPLGGSPLGLSRHAFAFGSCSQHLDVTFLLLADPSAPLLVSDESDAVSWFRLDALPVGVADDLPPRLLAAAAVVRGAQSVPGPGQAASSTAPVAASAAGAAAGPAGSDPASQPSR